MGRLRSTAHRRERGFVHRPFPRRKAGSESSGRLLEHDGLMAQAHPSRENFFGFLTDKKVTYHRDVAKERKERKAEAMADRRERLAVQELKAKEKAAEAKIADAQRKIDAAKSSLKTAEKKADKGGMAEAQFEAMKARMEREIEAQEKHKAAAHAKLNPQEKTFTRHFKSKEKAEQAAAKARETFRDVSIQQGGGWWTVFGRKPKARTNPAVSASQYRLAQAVLSD